MSTTRRRLYWLSSSVFLRKMTFQPLANRRHDEAGRARLGQLELDRVLVADVDLAHRAEQRSCAGWTDARRRLDDAVVGGLDVVGGELGAVVELHVLAQVERVGLAVLGDLPAMGEIGDDGLAAVARIAADQIVEHAALASQAVDGARLVHVEMRRPRGDAVAQDAAALGVGLGRAQAGTWSRRTRSGPEPARNRGAGRRPRPSRRRRPSSRSAGPHGDSNAGSSSAYHSCCFLHPLHFLVCLDVVR